MKKKILYLEQLRILSILMIMFMHRPAYHSTDVLQPVTLSYGVKVLIGILVRCGVPFFFMISGILLLGRKESIVLLLKKRILRFLAAMVIAYLCYKFCFPGRPELQAMIHTFNWFFYAYLAFLILLPVFRMIAQNVTREGTVYLLVLMFAAYTCYGVLQTASLHLPMVENVLHYGGLDRWPSEYWTMIFPLTGYLITHFSEKGFTEREQKIFWRVMAVLGVLSLAAAFFFYLLAVRTDNDLMREGALQYFLFAPSCLLFEGARRVLEPLEPKLPAWLAGATEKMGAAVFGVFIIEVQTPFSWILYEKLEGYLVPVLGPYFPSVVSVLIAFSAYMVFVMLLRLLPPVRKII